MRSRFLFLAACFSLSTPTYGQESVPDLLKTIRAVGKEGKGNAQAAKAWQAMVRQGPDVLIDVLAGLDDAGPVAENWIRAAVDAIGESARASGKRLPADRLEAFVKDTKRCGAGRKLAYDWLARADATAPGRLLPGMLDDPGAELRREAVAVVLEKAKADMDKDKAAATVAYQKALRHARDIDQVNKAAKELKDLGVEVDLTKQFGFLTHWQLIGPFDNVKGVGFAASYPPEKGFDPKATFTGKAKEAVAWKEHATDRPLGLVDLNKVYGNLKGAVVYGYATVDSAADQPVEIRAASANAVRIYVNGAEVYFREEYHHGMSLDQHVGKARLKKGKNEVLIKVCQNEQTESWAQTWAFQLRITDALGTPAEVTVKK